MTDSSTPENTRETTVTNSRRVINFKPGDRVQVRMPSYLKSENFDEDTIYEVKDGPFYSGMYQLWTDDGPRRYENVNDYYLVPVLDDEKGEVQA